MVFKWARLGERLILSIFLISFIEWFCTILTLSESGIIMLSNTSLIVSGLNCWIQLEMTTQWCNSPTLRLIFSLRGNFSSFECWTDWRSFWVNKRASYFNCRWSMFILRLHISISFWLTFSPKLLAKSSLSTLRPMRFFIVNGSI